LAKWTAQSILSGADQMKLGYVSRKAPNNQYDHEVLATQFFKPKELATQINLNVNNMWGIVKMISELLMGKEEGKYVLLKDPNKATVRLYSVPPGTFEEDDDERHIKNAYYWINRQVIEYKEWLDNLIDNYEEIKNRISAEQMRSDNKWFKKSILDTLNDLHNLKSEYIWEI
jgi:hypothetical protein